MQIPLKFHNKNLEPDLKSQRSWTGSTFETDNLHFSWEALHFLKRSNAKQIFFDIMRSNARTTRIHFIVISCG